MKVLVAEDDIVFQALFKGILKGWGYEILMASDGLQAMQLAEDNPDVSLFIVDWSMPWLDGLEFCKTVKKKDKFAYFIMISARNSTENLVEAMEQGVDDFISKPFVPEELKVRLKVGQKIIDKEKQLTYLANRDDLTGVWNRRMTIELLQSEWARSLRETLPLTLMFCDLDNFKQINDSHGHLVGDQVLKQFSSIVSEHLRPYDHFGRYGGEEFIIILPNTAHKDAMIVAERIRKVVEQTPLERAGEKPITYTVSIGLSQKQATDESYNSLIKRADDAAYKAKQLGRNRAVTLDPIGHEEEPET